jgi:hypothetical protein
MKKIGEEWALDWYTTRGGRTIIKPTFGESLKLRDLLGVVKTAPKKKKAAKGVKDNLYSFLLQNYDRTYICTEGNVIIIKRVMMPNTIKRSYPTAKSCYWGNNELDIFSNIKQL